MKRSEYLALGFAVGAGIIIVMWAMSFMFG